MGSTAVRRRGSPPHATPLDRERLATPSLVGRGGCSSPTSATYLSTRAPACIARLPRWPPLAQLPRPMGRTPAGDSSHGALDGAPRASTDAYSALATRRGRTPQNPGGLPIGKSPRRVSFHPRRFPPRMKRAHRPLTPRFTTCSPPSRRRALRTPPGPPSPPPRQGRWFQRPEAPSIAECPLGPPPLSERRTSNASPPPVPGLRRPDPASDAPSPPRSEEGAARPRPLPRAHRTRAHLATRRSSTSAIETIHKHDRRTSKPDSPGGHSTFAELLARVPVRTRRGRPPLARRTIPDETEPRIHGSGAFE